MFGGKAIMTSSTPSRLEVEAAAEISATDAEHEAGDDGARETDHERRVRRR